MAHHIIEDSSSLQIALPEPGHMGSSMLFGAARQVGASGQCRRTSPDDLPAADNTGLEDLIFQIAMQQSRFLDQFDDPLRFRDVARERLFDADPDERAFTGFDRSDNCLNIFYSSMIRSANPDSIDFG